MSIARQSYALTLYTLWHIEQRHERAGWVREAERHDMAGLVGIAFHEPKKLDVVHRRFLNRVLYNPERDARVRAQALEHIKRHAALVPIDAPAE